MNQNRLLFFCCLFLLFVTNNILFAADVYYLGGNDEIQLGNQRKYSLYERLHDLCDFSSHRSLSQRSGIIKGRFSTRLEYNKLSGNKSKSFLKEGVDYITELNLNLQEKLYSDYIFETELRLRKTDKYSLEPRKDVRVKQYSFKISNPYNLFAFGDFYGEFSPFTLNSSLEGFNLELKSSERFNVKMVVARKNAADEAASKFQRNVFGIKIDSFPLNHSSLFQKIRVGMQAVSIQDDSATADRTSSFKDLRNSIFSIDGEIVFVNNFSVVYEFARSFYLPDEDTSGDKDQSCGNSFHVAPEFQIGNTIYRYVYNYTQPMFYTDTGSASPDKIQHQFTINHRFNDILSVSFMENYYWDHLKNSSLSKRTITDEKDINVDVFPSRARKNLHTRFYNSYMSRNSDDPANTAESRTITTGFSIADQFGGTNIDFSYEYRAYSNLADKSLSEYFNRINCSFARELQIFSRRCYLSLNPSVDIRRSKKDFNKDVNLSLSFSGEYYITSNVSSRFGYNVIDSNAAEADKDYENYQNFTEIDWVFGRNKDKHIILKYNLTRHMNADGDLNYKEMQTILTYTCLF